MPPLPRSLLSRRHSSGYLYRILDNPTLLNAPTFVYAITDLTSIKIGRSIHHPILRLHTLQTGSSHPLHLLAYTTHTTEHSTHRQLSLYRYHHEWFHITATVLTELSSWDWLDTKLLAQLGR